MKITWLPILYLLSTLALNVNTDPANAASEKPLTCKEAQKYYLQTTKLKHENNIRKSFNFDQLMQAASCSERSGEPLLSIEQYKFITSLPGYESSTWSELIYLQLEQIVLTLKGIVRNSPPQNDEQRALVSQMMSLIETYGRDKDSSEQISPLEISSTTESKILSGGLWDLVARDLSWIYEFDIPGTEKEIKRYLSEFNYFKSISQRAKKYLGFIVSEVRRQNLPIELALIPIIESSLNPAAVSPQNAAGLWQIMPSTARQYRLSRNRWYDERLDVRTSTKIALKHLQNLNEKFDGDWLLTLAAYNSGSARIQRTLNKSLYLKNKWLDSIPKETSQYLARIFALGKILADPEKYGVQLPEVDVDQSFVVVSTKGQIELPLVAQLADLELAVLRAYNPGYLRWATPRRGYQELLMPSEHAELLTASLSKLSRENRMGGETYNVNPGDNLNTIADKLEVSVSLLRSINNVRRNMLWAGEKLLIPGTSFEPN